MTFEGRTLVARQLQRKVVQGRGRPGARIDAVHCRSPNGEVQEFKSGGFLLALQSKAPLVPVTISGTYSMLPRKGWCFWPGEISLTIGQPLLTQRLRPKDLPPLMAEVREEIIQNLKL